MTTPTTIGLALINKRIEFRIGTDRPTDKNSGVLVDFDSASMTLENFELNTGQTGDRLYVSLAHVIWITLAKEEVEDWQEVSDWIAGADTNR